MRSFENVQNLWCILSKFSNVLQQIISNKSLLQEVFMSEKNNQEN